MFPRTELRNGAAKALLVTTCMAAWSVAQAGVGPENLVIVLRADSWASRAVANHYAALRDVPQNRLIELDLADLNDFEVIDVETFRRRILQPVLNELDVRGLREQVTCIAYSADMPFAVNVAADYAGRESRVPQPPFTKLASINGLTYLYRDVLARDGYLALENNPRFRAPGEPTPPAPPGPPAHLLSCMLAVTSGRGTSVDEAIAALERAAGADGTRPDGTVYFMANDDIRSKTRQWAFEDAVAELERLGVKARILDGRLPANMDDVAGLVAGSPWLDLPRGGNRILPGAICENLTSWGGVMQWWSSQLPLTDFLRHGAAASSGTVVEPYAIQAKFPTAFLHCHYAAGWTMIESFYQSVQGPYQLLIVGDPLCAPWSVRPAIAVDWPDGPLSGLVELRPRVLPEGGPVARLELWANGLRMAQALPGEAMGLDSQTLEDGWHELRVVAVGADPAGGRGFESRLLRVDNLGLAVPQAQSPPGKPLGESVMLHADAPGGMRVEWWYNGQLLGTGESLAVDSARLGLGPVRLRLAGVVERDGGEQRAWGQPVDLTVEPPAPLAALDRPATDMEPGLLLRLAGGATRRVPALAPHKKEEREALAALAPPAGEPFLLEGWFEAPADGLYQVQLRAAKGLTLAINDQTFPPLSGQGWRFVPVSLGAGWHRLRLLCADQDLRTLDVRFGGPGSQPLGERRFRSP